MKYLAFTALLLCYNFTYAQNIVSLNDITYATAKNWRNEVENLTLDVRYPQGNKKSPLILFIHGGGFFMGDKNDERDFCNDMAERGYATATINYRLGFDTSATGRDAGIVMAVYRAAQDVDTALRFLAAHAHEWNIDPSYVFIGGSSAGAVLSLSEAFVQDSEWNKAFPMLRPQLGPLHSTTQTLKPFSLRGVFSISGGIIDTTFISPGEIRRTPILLFHSEADEVIPYEHAKGNQTQYKALYGAFDITQRFRSNQGCYQLYFEKTGKHGYGFSNRYLVDPVSSFINNVLAQDCAIKIVERTDRLKDTLANAISNSGIDSAVKLYYAIKAAQPSGFDFTEDQLNQLGYQLLQSGKMKEAITVFQLNVKEHPGSWNVYDSLGEAYMYNGEKTEAIESYQKSVRLNPNNANGISMLQKLKAR